MGTDPPRLARLPAKSRSITCVTLEHAMVSYSSLWHAGGHTWQIRHDSSQGSEHLELSGDLPAGFVGIRDIGMRKGRAQEERRKPGEWGVDYVFDVPLDTAAAITGFRHDRMVENDFFTSLQSLVPTNGNVLTKLSHPSKWWQTVGSIEHQ
jgi:hypothetical protein